MGLSHQRQEMNRRALRRNYPMRCLIPSNLNLKRMLLWMKNLVPVGGKPFFQLMFAYQQTLLRLQI